MTRWAELRQRCADKGCELVFRAETVRDEVRYSLAARKGVEIKQDIRLSRPIDEAAGVPEELLDRALAEWWA